MRFFGQIQKSEELEDGTIRVFGIASTGVVDSDGETILPEAIKAALPAFKLFPAIREMHQPMAAGTALEAYVNDSGEFELVAHIVDPIAISKVKAGVYKGFSIGGKVRGRDPMNKTIITAMDLVEVSLVDRPANPGAVINMWKADMSSTDSTSKTESAATIKKGMYAVSRFAELLCSLGSLAGDAEWEASYEKDASPVPQQLRDWLSAGAELFEAMAQEETAELIESLQATATANAAAKAAATGDIAKAGARFSKSSKATLAALHKALKDGDALMCKLGYADEKDADSEAQEDEGPSGTDAASDSKKSAAADDVTKAAEIDIVAKAAVVAADKADAIAKALAPVAAELSIAKARVAELEALPMPAKGVLTVVEKSSSSKDSDAVQPVKKADGTVDDTATAIKKAMQTARFTVGR